MCSALGDPTGPVQRIAFQVAVLAANRVERKGIAMKHAVRFAVVAAIVAILQPGQALANGFQQLEARSQFLSVIEGRKLTRMGIELDVTPSGEIRGRAFGRPVVGAWNWQDGYFCRDLYWGQRNLGPNCQAVQLDGRTIRFISDRGTGEFADLRLRD
jgi:hypothetical protein